MSPSSALFICYATNVNQQPKLNYCCPMRKSFGEAVHCFKHCRLPREDPDGTARNRVFGKRLCRLWVGVFVGWTLWRLDNGSGPVGKWMSRWFGVNANTPLLEVCSTPSHGQDMELWLFSWNGGMIGTRL